MPCASRKRREIREFSVDAVFLRTTAPEYGIIRTDNSRIFAFYASIGTSETWKVQSVCQTKRECAQLGASLFRGSHRAFPGPQTKHGQRLRPLSLPVIETRARRGDGWTRKSAERSRDGTNAPIICCMSFCSGWLRTDQRG